MNEVRGAEDRRETGLTNICSLYHAHVVPTIANATHSFLGVVTNEARNICFLRRRTAAGDNSGQLCRYFNELVLVQVQTELSGRSSDESNEHKKGPTYLQGFTIDDKTTVKLRLQKLELVANLVRRLHYVPTRSAPTTSRTRKKNERTFRNLVDVLIPRNEFRRDGDTSRRLDLVARQHPNLDPRVPQQLQRRLDLILELILDARQTEQLQIPLQIIRDNARHRLVPPLGLDARFVVPVLERGVLLRRQPLPPDYQRPQSLPCHVPSLLLQPVVLLHDLCHDHVCAFLQEQDVAGVGLANDDTHTFGLGGEGEELEDVVVERRASRGL